jgi:hypothetical protein
MSAVDSITLFCELIAILCWVGIAALIYIKFAYNLEINVWE